MENNIWLDEDGDVMSGDSYIKTAVDTDSMYDKIVDIWLYVNKKKEGEKKPIKLKWFEHKVIHLIATFILGVALATAYHLIVTNNQVITTAERVCDAFGRDAEECRNGISDVLNMSDNEVQNNININGGGK